MKKFWIILIALVLLGIFLEIGQARDHDDHVYMNYEAYRAERYRNYWPKTISTDWQDRRRCAQRDGKNCDRKRRKGKRDDRR